MADAFLSDTELLAKQIPKAELHIHLEGAISAETLFQLSLKNGVAIPFASPKEIRLARTKFDSPADLLKVYKASVHVLRTREDFRQITLELMEKVSKQGVRHMELMIDPQTHTERGVAIQEVLFGVLGGCEEAAARWGTSFAVIPCIQREKSAEDANSMLESLIPHLAMIDALGLSSFERGNPPSKFRDVLLRAKRLGLKTVAHAGEEGPPEYIWEALDLFVDRIDHGTSMCKDEKLVAQVIKTAIPVTVCPVSDVCLNVVANITDHPMRSLFQRGVVVCLASDDPEFCDGQYVGDVFRSVVKEWQLSKRDVVRLALNSIQSSFAPPMRKAQMIHEVYDLCRDFGVELGVDPRLQGTGSFQPSDCTGRHN
eukprot:ANDGO_04125.mRNA.1 Adenine deaminase